MHQCYYQLQLLFLIHLGIRKDYRLHLSRLFRQGEISVRSRFLPDLGIVQAEVQDNGAGIDAEKSSQLFDPYTTTKDHGTGLGLTIVSQTVTDHQGFVRFSSGEGGGAVFTIELPVM